LLYAFKKYTVKATKLGAIKLIKINLFFFVKLNNLAKYNDKTLKNPSAIGAMNV
jgi:hypothetical protein